MLSHSDRLPVGLRRSFSFDDGVGSVKRSEA